MPRSVAPVMVLLAFVAVSVPFVFAGCAGAENGETHGPVFVFDGSTSGSSDGGAVNDGNGNAPPNEASVTDAPGSDANERNGDDGSSSDAGASDASDGATANCTSPTVVLAGSGSTLVGAVSIGAGAFTTQSLTGSAVYGPALVASSNVFEALVAMNVDAGGGGALYGVGLSGTTWGSPAALGGSASAIDAPAIAALGTTLQGVYLDPGHLYFHAQFSGTSWDTGADPVQVGTAPQSFGPVRAAAAAASSTELVITYEGNDGHIYAQSWLTTGGWQTAVKIGDDTLATNTAPAIVALSGGTSDLLVVYALASTQATNYLNYALRTASTKTWSTPAATNGTAYTLYAPSLAPMSGGRAIVGWRGGNNLPYSMEFTPSPSPAWSVPVPMAASGNITSAPSLATGTCGNEAVAALATEGAVTISTYASGAWVTPTPITGISGASFAAIATSP